MKCVFFGHKYLQIYKGPMNTWNTVSSSKMFFFPCFFCVHLLLAFPSQSKEVQSFDSQLKKKKKTYGKEWERKVFNWLQNAKQVEKNNKEMIDFLLCFFEHYFKKYFFIKFQKLKSRNRQKKPHAIISQS